MVMNALRQGAKSGVSKFILFGFMAMAVGGLVLADNTGLLTGQNPANATVASIGKDKLSGAQFDRLVRRTLSYQGVDTQTAWQLGLIDQILNTEISSNLLTRAAHDTGLIVSDDVVARQVAEIVTPYVDGQTTRKDALRRLLAAQGMGEAEFVGAIRQEMTNNLLRNTLTLAAAVTDEAEVRDLYQYTHESRTLTALVLPHDKGLTVEEPTDEILLPFYQSGQEKYAIPETRSLTVAVLSENAIKDSVKITDEDLQAQYDEQIEAYHIPEKRRLEQTILTDRAQADAVAKRVQDGTALKDAVKAETGNNDAYLGLADFEQKGLAREIAGPAFSGDKGDVIGPVQSALGWHVLVLKDIVAPRTRPFTEVKDELRKTMQQARLSAEMFALSAQIDDGIAAGTPLEELAETLNLQVDKFGPVRADGSTVDAKDGFRKYEADREKILASAFELLAGETSAVMDMNDGGFVVVRADEIFEKTYRPFDDVKADLARLWMQDQREALNKQRAEKALLRLETGETTLDDLAKELGVTPRSYTLARAADLEPPFTNAARGSFFGADKNTYVMAPGDKGFIVGQVTGITIPDVEKAKKDDLDLVRKNALRSTQEEYLLLYLESLREKYGVKINRDLLKQIYEQQGNDQVL